MDNLTHSLVGAAVAECVYYRSPSIRRRTLAPFLRQAFWIASIAAANIPDFDLLYGILGGKLGYLIHHRGHTHTLFFAIVQGYLIARGVLWWVRKKGRKLDLWDTRAIYGVAIGGCLLHIGMDALNNYGVHPFWPLWNGWIYGDSVFIMEPLLWVSLLPVVYYVSQNRRFRWFVEAFFVALFTALCILPITRWYSVLFLALVALGVWGACRRSIPRWRADLGLSVSLLFVTCFSLMSLFARLTIVRQVAKVAPGVTLHDVVLTPFPANPLCFNVVTVETSDGRYRLRRGVFTPFAPLMTAQACPRFPSKGSTANLSPVSGGWGPSYAWEGQYQASIGDLKDYSEYSCPWRNLLKFSRAPFIQEEGGRLWAGDLRYDYGPELGFAELEMVDQEPPCSRLLPRWLSPRRDIF